ncbi:MAG: PEP-CTERM system TPR-repeat protein PrsT [Gammaproteobacteria bacterium]|nr:PEP-CTERM system TPR-repeat protein PrsT [Gammaproteobacteria bacterium]
MNIKIKTLIRINRVLLIAVTIALLGCSPEVSDEQMVQTARTYIDKNQLREAALELKNVLQRNSDNAEARYLLGIINLDIGDAASAEKEFRRAASAGWQEGLARVGQARAMINSKAFQKLIDEIEIKNDYPANIRADLYALHALAQAGLGNIVESIETLNKASEIDANAFHVLKSSIQIYLANNDMVRAKDSLKMALITYGENLEILLLSAAIAIEDKDYVGASETYKKIIEQEPDKLVTIYGRRARLALARFEILNKEFDKAKLTLQPLFKQSEGDPETNFVGGLLAFEQGDLSLAEERLLSVLKVAPNHAPTQLLFGTVSYAQQDYEQAVYYIAKYVSVAPENLGARKLLGRAYIQMGQNNEAQAALQPGLKNSSEDAELLALVSFSQLQGGDIASGIAGLEKAVKVEPESIVLRNELARAYISAGETENAIRELNTILVKDGDKQQAEILLISAHIKAEHYDKAIDVVLDMLKKSPDNPAVLALAGNVFVVSNDRPEARKYFNKALEIKPDYMPASMLLARLEEIEEHPAEAESLYKKLADKNLEDISPMMALARLAETQKQPQKMVEWLEKARKTAPNEIKPRKILAEYYLRENQLDKVAQLITEAIKIAPRDNALLLLEARLQIAQGQNNKALPILNELVTKVPDSVLARTMLGETYLKLGQLSDARRQVSIVLEKQAYYAPALLLMAGIELRAGNYDQVLNYAMQVQKVWVDSYMGADAYMGYELAGDAYIQKKNYANAKVNYEQAWQRKQSSELAIKLSDVLVRSGEFDTATKPLLAWLSSHPDEVRVLQFLGSTYQNMKQNKEAIKAYEKVLTIQVDNLVALNNLAWLYSLANNPKSLELAERAYNANSSDASIQDTYGWVLVQQGQTDKGLGLLEQVMKSLPGVPEVQYHYAVALMKSGEEIKGRQILGKLLSSGKSFEGRDSAEKIMN